MQDGGPVYIDLGSELLLAQAFPFPSFSDSVPKFLHPRHGEGPPLHKGIRFFT
jgi:hypothetical protein